MNLAKLFFSPAAYGLWLALDNPENWELEEYTILHRPTRMEFWSSSGPLMFNGHRGVPGCIGLLERFVLWPKVRRMRSRKVFLKFIDSRLA